MEANDKYSGALEVDLVRSRIVPAFVALGCVSTLGVLALTPLPAAASILAGTWALCLALDALRRARRHHRLAIGSDGDLALDGIAGTLRAGSFVAPWLTIVRCRPAGARLDRTLLVATDMLGEAPFRDLRVILKNQKPGTDPNFNFR